MANDTKVQFKNDKYWTDNLSPFLSNNIATFFYQEREIASRNWNQLFPFQLLLLEMVPLTGESSNPVYKRTKYSFTLPIPPQELNTNMPFATTVQATLNGIVEQHGGAPFRDIILTGTTGITPIKNNSAPLDISNQLVPIFAGTVRAAAATVASANSIINPGRPNINEDITSSPQSQQNALDDNFIPEKSTGYYQFRLLEQFLESYVELKRKNAKLDDTIEAKNLRLALAVWKDEAVYLCSGVQLQKKRSAVNPQEYMYTLQLKAWKRVSGIVGQTSLDFNHQFVARQANGLTSLLNRMNALSETIDQFVETGESIIIDPLHRISEISRTVQLFTKTVTNASESIMDMPESIKQEISLILRQAGVWGALRQFLPELDPNPPSILQDGLNKVFNQNFNQDSNNTTGSALTGTPQRTPSNRTSKQELNDLFRKIQPNQLPLPRNTITKIQAEKQRVKNFNRFDFEQFRNEIVTIANTFADAIGAGSSTVDLIYNKTPVQLITTPSDEQFNTLYALNELAIILDHLAASATINPPFLNSLEYVAGLAQNSGIAFTVPTSKFAVPFPYGTTLERLSEQYLKSPDRWNEIATLNGLRAPYVDEVGFSLPFLINGDGRKFYVSDKTNLFINQVIYISSKTQIKSKRRITDLKEIYPGFVEVTVDGDSNLDSFLIQSSAIMEAFLPGTVNSQQIIYIPSDKAAPEDPKTKQIPGIDEFDPLLQISGVDLLLTSSGDLAVTEDGDCKLAFGLQNIIQTIKLALTTPQGSLLQHPDYGLPVQVGDSTADVTAAEIIKSVSRMFEGDPTFSGVSSAQVVKNGNTVQITLILSLAGLSNNVPISFTIQR